jgi:hypothetical protein
LGGVKTGKHENLRFTGRGIEAGSILPPSVIGQVTPILTDLQERKWAYGLNFGGMSFCQYYIILLIFIET